MLAKINRLAKQKDFDHVFKRGKSVFSANLKLRFVRNELKNSRFAFVVSNKISKKATVRNRIRRQLSEIVRTNLTTIKKGNDVVVVVKQTILKKDFEQITNELLTNLKKAKLS
ncbi:ribonuclease P protein component [Patescibacteria group bacterium]|nr:ribonuclease P protein component [Patescibacteria group bacterium]